MKTLFVPLDGSSMAEQVLPYVRLLAKYLDTKVHLFRVIPDEGSDVLFEPEYVCVTASGNASVDTLTYTPQIKQHSYRHELQEAEQYLIRKARVISTDGVYVDVEVCRGVPSELIVAYAERLPDPLITMATHGYGGFQRWRVGSVADAVIHATMCPVFLVHGVDPLPQTGPALRRILVPLDGSSFARQALPYALELATRARAELMLLHTVEPIVETYGVTYPLTANDAKRHMEEVQKELATLATELSASHIKITPITSLGFVVEDIVNVAAQHTVDLIVMATHGRTGLARWVLGNKSDQVLHATTTPLLLVRPGD